MKTNVRFRGSLSKDGFTLIELLSVIILIIGIMLIVLPKITGSVKNKELAINTSYENIIYKALDLYISDNSRNYPKVTTNTYCVAVDTLKGKGYLKDYDNENVKAKNIVKVTYSGGYHYEMVDECTEQITDYDKCTEEGKCSACMVLSEYNTLKEVYKYTPKIVKDVKISDGNLVNGTDITIVRNNDECVKEAIISAAKDHVVNNPKVYKKNRNNTYCISVESLINEGRLENNLIYLNKSITNYSVEVKYTNKFNYNLLESSSCKEKIMYEDETIDGNDPYLNGDLTPVIYDSTDKVWRIADPYSKWYDYKNFKWANAVLLRPGVTKKVGDIVNIESADPYEIISIFVWIPRYEYKIEGQYGRGGKKYYPGEIDVNFISVDKKNTDGFITPPGFKFGDENLNGFWISKFYAGINAKNKEAIISSVANANMSGIPSDYKYCVNQGINKYFTCHFFSVKNMTLDPIYGLNDSIYDSHMMKNAEYAAVSYLSQSKYGKYGNDMFPAEYKTITPTNPYTGQLYLDNTHIPYNDDHFTKTIYKQKDDEVKIITFNDTSITERGTHNWSYTINISEKSTLSFSYQIKGGWYKDYISYSLKKASTNEVISSNKLSSSGSKNVSLMIDPGKYTLDFTYLKNKDSNIYSASSTNVKIKEGGWGNVVEEDYYNGVASSTTGTVYGVYDLLTGSGTSVSAFFGNIKYTDTFEVFDDTVVDSKYYDMYILVKGDSSCTASSSDYYCIKSKNTGNALPPETNLWSWTFSIAGVNISENPYLIRGDVSSLYRDRNIFSYDVSGSDVLPHYFIILTYK